MEGMLFDDCRFGLVQEVTIESVTDKTVTFRARSASKSGDPDECLLRSFTVPLSEVYTAPIPGAPAATPMKPGATGPLYLSRDAWSSVTSDGFPIYGLAHAIFKWPDCASAPSRVLSLLPVIPASIVVRGRLEGGTELFELDLLGPDAAPDQDITWSGAACIQVRLTERGAARLRIRSGSTSVRVWPTAIRIQGAPVIDPALCGEVDLLNTEQAGELQQLSFEKPGQPIALSLTQDGFNAFHVTPQIVDELTNPARAS